MCFPILDGNETNTADKATLPRWYLFLWFGSLSFLPDLCHLFLSLLAPVWVTSSTAHFNPSFVYKPSCAALCQVISYSLTSPLTRSSFLSAKQLPALTWYQSSFILIKQAPPSLPSLIGARFNLSISASPFHSHADFLSVYTPASLLIQAQIYQIT